MTVDIRWITKPLEEIRERHSSTEAMGHEGPYLFCLCCDERWPCPDYKAAALAAQLLKEME